MMSTSPNERSHTPLGRSVEVVTLIAMAFMAVAIIATVAGVNGLRVFGGPDGVDPVMSVVADVRAPLDMDELLPITVDDFGQASVFGQAPVRATSPTAHVDFLDPTSSQRVIWLIWQISGPVLGLLVAWPVLQMARSTRRGDPFTPANERRLWTIAGLVATGGIAYSVVAGFARMLLVQRSAAADLFAITYEISFLPIIAGVVIAALASIWRIGVALRDDVHATI